MVTWEWCLEPLVCMPLGLLYMRSWGLHKMKPIHTKYWLEPRREEALTRGSKLAFHFGLTQFSSLGLCQILSFVHWNITLPCLEYEFFFKCLNSIMSRYWGSFNELDQWCTRIWRMSKPPIGHDSSCKAALALCFTCQESLRRQVVTNTTPKLGIHKVDEDIYKRLWLKGLNTCDDTNMCN